MRSSHVIEAAVGHEMERAQETASQPRSFRTTGSAGLERVLLVEPNKTRRAHLRDAVREVADIHADADFVTARTHLFSEQYDWLVTNTRLGPYNGLHLVYLARVAWLPIRSLVYDESDLWLAQEAQRAGAFYESRSRVNRALPAYLRSVLPPQDRRSPAEPDRRAAPRGGRRCTDSAAAASFA
jgi:hypothetical protein